MRRPRASNMARIRAAISSSRTSGTPSTSAMASRVMSSWVGPEPAAHEHRVGPAERLAERGDDAVVVVTDLRLVVDVDAGEGELLPEPRPVGVDDLPEQQLGPDGDHLADHDRSV